MATVNLSEYCKTFLLDKEQISGMKFDIIVSDWNNEVTGKLLDGAVQCLTENGISKQNMAIFHVPGSFELVYAAANILHSNTSKANAIIVLGCVVRGGTPHFDYVCSGVTQGIAQLNAKGDVPVIFGLLTTDDMQQSLDRAGGKLGNKGVEAAQTAIKMACLREVVHYVEH